MSRALFTIDNWTQNIRGRGWQKWACIGFAAEDAPSGTGTLHFLTFERDGNTWFPVLRSTDAGLSKR